MIFRRRKKDEHSFSINAHDESMELMTRRDFIKYVFLGLLGLGSLVVTAQTTPVAEPRPELIITKQVFMRKTGSSTGYSMLVEKLFPEYNNVELYMLAGSGTFMSGHSPMATIRYGGYRELKYDPYFGKVAYFATASSPNSITYLYAFPSLGNLMSREFSSTNIILFPGVKMIVYKISFRLCNTDNINIIISGNSMITNPRSIPNQDIPYFRYYSDLDRTWKCVQRDHLGGETVVDSNVVPDTKPHVFKIEYLIDRTKFYIDDRLVADITTNVDRLYQDDQACGLCLMTTDAFQKSVAVQYIASAIVFE